MSKAWWVKDHPDTDWGLYVHADTRGQAKVIAKSITPAPESFEVWPDIVAWRVPSMDNRAFTYANLEAASIPQVDDCGDPLATEYGFEVWLDCPCDDCHAAAKEWA